MPTYTAVPLAHPRVRRTAVARVEIVPSRGGCGDDDHDFATLQALARRLALLHGCEYSGVYQGARPRGEGRTYFVPQETLLRSHAQLLDVAHDRDLFGGVVPHPFVATKVISHPALDGDALVPQGWSHGLSGRLSGAVLPGFAVFSRADARRACMQLLRLGPLRVKPAHGKGGNGQALVADPGALEAALQQIDDAELARHGCVLEQHLEEATTRSIGTVDCAGLRISYVGTQRTTRNRDGAEVYGGSDLVAVRGGYDALGAIGLDEGLRQAVRLARRYHAAVQGAYPEFFASRVNYDVIQGVDRDGVPHCGVLEQSWRIGGASPAEISALEAFAADPGLQVVEASSHEFHGPHAPPDGARVHYRDIDPRWGPMTKYSTLRAHGYPAQHH